MRNFFGLFILLVLLGCAVEPEKAAYQEEPQDNEERASSAIFLLADWHAQTDFSGQLDRSASSSTGGLVYSGDAGAAGLVAQIFAHAAIEGSMQKKKANARQIEADKVLEDFQGAIESLKNSSLVSSGNEKDAFKEFDLQKINDVHFAAPRSLVAKIYPRYIVSNDKRTIMLDMKLELFRKHEPDDVIFAQTVKAVSKSVESDSPVDIWLSGSPSHFELTSKDLFAEGLYVLLKDFYVDASTETATQKTYKFSFGSRSQYQRAHIIDEACDRLKLRNLNKELLIIPRDGSCEKEPVESS